MEGESINGEMTPEFGDTFDALVPDHDQAQKDVTQKFRLPAQQLSVDGLQWRAQQAPAVEEA